MSDEQEEIHMLVEEKMGKYNNWVKENFLWM